MRRSRIIRVALVDADYDQAYFDSAEKDVAEEDAETLSRRECLAYLVGASMIILANIIPSDKRIPKVYFSRTESDTTEADRENLGTHGRWTLFPM